MQRCFLSLLRPGISAIQVGKNVAQRRAALADARRANFANPG
jgi:hypothetical protein